MYFGRGLSKSIKKYNFIFFFWTQSLLMDKVIKNKRGLELVTSHSSGRETSSEKFLYSLYIIWPSLMMKCKAFSELLQKLHQQIYASQFMTSWIIPLPYVLLNLECVKRKGKNHKNLNILTTKRAFSMK